MSATMDPELEMLLRLGVRALRKLPGRLLQASERDPAPLRHKAQMRIAAERSLMAQLAQKVAHVGMALQVPGC